MEGSMQVSLAIWGKGYHLRQQCNSWGKKKKTEGWKVICMVCPVQRCHIGQDSAVTWVSISWWPDRGNEAQVYNGIILKKNEVMSFGITQKEQELIMLSEASQSQKKMPHDSNYRRNLKRRCHRVEHCSLLIRPSVFSNVLKTCSPASVVALLAGKPSKRKSSLKSHTMNEIPGSWLLPVSCQSQVTMKQTVLFY